MIGALDGEAAVLELDIGGGSFQKLLGDACSPGNDVVGRFLDHDRAEPHAAA
jgi:predicted methyltransferase